MMATTHAAAAVCLISPLLYVAPELAVSAAVGAMLGGVLPDVDLFVGTHRKSLHYPALYWLPATVAATVAAIAPAPASVALAGVFVGAAFHSLSDVLGAGDEARPWEATSERGVFCHLSGRWLRPYRLVPYDGSPQDLLAVAVLSVPGLVLFDGVVQAVTAAFLAISVVYALFRRRMPAWIR